MTKTAIFSNGHTDTYKGNRDVRAAWMIVRKSDGKVLSSGHSLDRVKAEKTANGNTRYHLSEALGRSLNGISDRPDRWASRCAYFGKLAREMGFSSWKEAYNAYQAEAEVARRNLTIEVIDL